MLRYLRYLILLAIAFALLVLAMANRAPVLVQLLPDGDNGLPVLKRKKSDSCRKYLCELRTLRQSLSDGSGALQTWRIVR